MGRANITAHNNEKCELPAAPAVFTLQRHAAAVILP